MSSVPSEPLIVSLEMFILSGWPSFSMFDLMGLFEYPGDAIVRLAEERARLQQQVLDLMEEINELKGL